MNKIDAIIVHCTATKEDIDFHVADIDRMHRQRGFNMIGYHYLVTLDGTVEEGRPLPMDGAHCNSKDKDGVSYNKHSIGIVYVGGLDKNGKPKDTRTFEQKRALLVLIQGLVKDYAIKEILGHRDTSPDLNGDGEIEASEWIKACPCFNAKAEYADLLIRE